MIKWKTAEESKKERKRKEKRVKRERKRKEKRVKEIERKNA